MPKYKSKDQHLITVDVVTYLLNLSARKGTRISRETLDLIVSKYVDIMDPPQGPLDPVNEYKG